MATNIGKPANSDTLTAEQRQRAEAVRRLLSEWLADDSGYDEQVWPVLSRGFGESRTPSRPLFWE